MIPLAVFEEVTGGSGVAPRIEAMLPIGVRRRQLKVRTLLAGMCLAQAGHRPAHLTRVHQALTRLSEDDQIRLGILADWKGRPHRLTCWLTRSITTSPTVTTGGPGSAAADTRVRRSVAVIRASSSSTLNGLVM